MPEVILFPDAGAVVIDYLDANITPPVMSRVPNPRVATFVTCRRSGGVRQTIVSDAATLLLECWAELPEDAMDLAQQCRGLVLAMQDTVQSDVPVYRVQEFAGPADLPDPTSNQARVVLTMQVQLRGQPA